jgi:hypothetical protein
MDQAVIASNGERSRSPSQIPTICAVLVLAGLVAWSPGIADTWALPAQRSYLSSDRTWRLTVTPRAIASQLAYFEDKVAKRDAPGAPPGQSQKQAQGLMEHFSHGQWEAVWNEPLLNEVSPVQAIVSSAGFAVTFDNWHGMGYGTDAVVIYTPQGKVVRAMGLSDFLPKEYIRVLPRSVSSIWWGDHHHFSIDGKRVVLRIVVPSVKGSREIGGDHYKHVELAFDLTTGQAAPPEPKSWSDALAAVRKVNVEDRAAEAEQEARFVAPLTGPHSDAEQDWHLYLQEAFFRVDPEWQDSYPRTTVLRLPKQQNYQASVGFLRDALHDEIGKDGIVMIASPSQDNLLRVLSRLAADLPNGALKSVRIYVAVDEAHSAAVAKALALTGATYVQLDPNRAIPQRAARLEAYHGNSETGDPPDR